MKTFKNIDSDDNVIFENTTLEDAVEQRREWFLATREKTQIVGPCARCGHDAVIGFTGFTSLCWHCKK